MLTTKSHLNFFVLTSILVFFDSQLVKCQDQKGFINIPDASRNRIKVLLECGPKMMNIKIFFNRTIFPAFGDWIVVGFNNRIECRQQGNGDLQYVVDIPLISDPCGTKMLEQGTFENSISVKKHPLLILEGDEVITVRCAYSPPEIGKAILPSLSGSQGIELPSVPTPLYPIISSSVTPVVAMGTMYIIIFLVLFLVLLCLLCLCACFFVRRRKKRMERRKKIFHSVPQSSELNKMGIGHLWWTGKASCSNDALLSHDYMVSTNSTREHLSISTEYPNDTTPTNSSSSPNDGTFPTQPHYAREVKHMIPRAHIDSGSGSNVKGIVISTYIPEEQKRPHFKNPSTGHNLRTTETLAYRSEGGLLFNAQPVYAHINTNTKTGQDISPVSNPSTLGLDTVDISQKDRSSTTKTFADNSTHPSFITDKASKLAKSQIHTHLPTTLVAADIHIKNNGTLYLNHESLKSLHQNETTSENVQHPKKVDLDVIIRAIEQNKGTGTRQLSEADLKKLTDLVEDDVGVRNMILHAKSADDFEAISHMPRCENLYSQEKWAIIVRSLAQVGFMQQLSVANQTGNTTFDITSPPSTNSQTVSISPKAESEESFESSDNEQMAPERRVFTRESYYQVKNKVESSTDSSTSADRSTSEIAEPVQFYNFNKSAKSTSERSSSELLEHSPVLNVYVGNVPNRAINVQQYGPNGNGNGNNGYYYRELGGNWDEASIYSTVNTQVPGNNSHWQSSHKM